MQSSARERANSASEANTCKFDCLTPVMLFEAVLMIPVHMSPHYCQMRASTFPLSVLCLEQSFVLTCQPRKVSQAVSPRAPRNSLKVVAADKDTITFVSDDVPFEEIVCMVLKPYNEKPDVADVQSLLELLLILQGQVWTSEISSFIKICYTELDLTHEQVSQLVRHVYGQRFEAAGRRPEEPTADTVMGHYKWRYSKGRPVYWPRIDPSNGQITIEGYMLLQQVRPVVHRALEALQIPMVPRTTPAFNDSWSIVGPQPAPPGVVITLNPAPTLPVPSDGIDTDADTIVVAPRSRRAPQAAISPVQTPRTTGPRPRSRSDEDSSADQSTGMVTRSRSARDPGLLQSINNASPESAHRPRREATRPQAVRRDQPQAPSAAPAAVEQPLHSEAVSIDPFGIQQYELRPWRSAVQAKALLHTPYGQHDNGSPRSEQTVPDRRVAVKYMTKHKGPKHQRQLGELALEERGRAKTSIPCRSRRTEVSIRPWFPSLLFRLWTTLLHGRESIQKTRDACSWSPSGRSRKGRLSLDTEGRFRKTIEDRHVNGNKKRCEHGNFFQPTFSEGLGLERQKLCRLQRRKTRSGSKTNLMTKDLALVLALTRSERQRPKAALFRCIGAKIRFSTVPQSCYEGEETGSLF
nr:hypothetical protein CFP56_25907 [Quercus suber]